MLDLLPARVRDLVLYLELNPLGRLLVAVLIALLVWATTSAATRWLLAFATRVASKTRTSLDDELLGRIRRPASLLGPVLGAHAFALYVGAAWVSGGASLIETMVVTYVAVATFEILVIETWLEGQQQLAIPTPVRQLLIGVVYGAVLLGIGGEVLGFDLTPLLATGSVTSLVLGLALQQPLSNLFAGIVLHVERQPRVGDWLLIDGREGEVIEIGWRTTRLRTFSRDVLVVPNNSVLNAQVLNFSQPGPECGRQVPVPVPLDVPPHVFDRWARDALTGIDGIVGVEEPRTKVWLVSVDDHCQRYVVRFWAAEFRVHDDCESEFLKRLWYTFQEHGLSFPAPLRAVRLVGDAPAPAMSGLVASRPPGFPPAMPRPTGTGEPTPR